MSLRHAITCMAIAFLLHPCVQAQQPAQTTAASTASPAQATLSSEQIDAITKKYQPIIDQAAALDTNGYLQKADALSARYMHKDFLDPILDPEGTRIAKQTKFNNTLRWSVELPISQIPFGIGIYNGDLLQAGAMGSAWALEWWFYYTMEQALAEGYTDLLITHATEVCAALQPIPEAVTPSTEGTQPTTQPSLQSVLAWPRIGLVIPRPTKKMLALMVGYAAGSLAMRWAHNRLLLDTTPSTDQQPMPISALIPAPIASILTSCCYPQSWTDSINTLFKRFHLLPAWIDRSELVMARSLIVMLFWLRWHIKHITIPLLEQQLTTNADSITPLLTRLAALREKAKTQQLTPDEQQAFNAAQAALKALVQPAVDVSFSTWIYFKTIQISLWHSITNILLATPAWYKVGCWAYNLYTMRN